ncbi:gp7 [Solibacillus silvestris StLB046]|uniref:Gp7 n=1 Tax=Solibacillus silvestris (strain StLB046) TaxID=1002809 RepID=F2F2L0_SOLSS|nr:hypothetical protein [Solibacillus silvestris]BAK15848.1 gp7 [Solibacillus silvestris StLB046]
MNEITKELLAEFKERMKLSDDEDGNLTRILSASVEDLTDKCGLYDLHTSARFKELVFERSRYAYNDALEYFNANFLTQINSLALSRAFAEMRELDATIQIYPQIK